jgi:hypothetical protein
MATRKKNEKKAAPAKSTMIKIAEKVGELAGKIVNEKEHLVEMAGGAIKSVKATIHNITATKKTAKAVVKKVEKKIIKPAAKKITKAAAKKAAPVKKTIKKVVKKAAKKVAAKKR